MKTREEILQILKECKPIIFDKYGIKNIGLFGSFARNTQTEESDVDIFYEGAVLSFLDLDLLQTELETKLDCPVDLVRIRINMNTLLKQQIEKEGIYA
ncbi:MAG: nucleotidyltransferase domain-containing protein [Bacteroidales bacterium]|nr:nucleotidyltransferase domain-containing protein [Bacteroidales bacterium]